MTPTTVREAVRTTRECVAHPRSEFAPGFASYNAGFCDGCCDAIASAVLAAADAGETEGPYVLEHLLPEPNGDPEAWLVSRGTLPLVMFPENYESEARAVCSALNRAAARERGVG